MIHLRTFGLLLALLLAFNLGAQRLELQFPDARSTAGLHLTNQEANGLRAFHAIPEMALVEFEDNGQVFTTIDMQGVFLPNNEGAPNLPGNGRFVAVPKGANPELIVHSYKKYIVSDIDFLPSPAIPLANDDSPPQFIKDMNIYNRDAYYPAEPFVISEITSVRGVDVAMLGITPFQYNPVSKELVIYYDVDLEIVFHDGSNEFGDYRLRSRWFDPILQDALLNPEALPAVDYTARFAANAAKRSEGAEYIVIVPDHADFLAWADSIRVFRTRQGITTQVYTTTEIGGNTYDAIKSFISNAYNNWDIPPVAFLLLADYGNSGNTITSQTRNDHPYGGSSAYVSDNNFADMTNNHLPDMVKARITARHAADLEIMVPKFLNYERSPPTNQHFYDNPITAMGWQTERWFQICSETVNGFWEFELGKTPLRQNNIYSGSPGSVWSTATNTNQVVNTFGPSGLNYIPATPAHLHNFGWSANATSINNAINAGAFMVMHRDHGLETGWGEPYYRNEHLGGLNNDDLTFVFSINCLTGKFNWSGESFTEAIHRHPKGALGVTAASEISYSFVNDTYVWGMMDNMWPDFMPQYGSNPESRGVLPAFGNVAGKYFLQQSGWPSNTQHKQITYYLFHHHGDAFSTVYTMMPQALSVNHLPAILSSMSEIEVTANPGALIALSVDNELIGVGEGTGAALPIPISMQLPGTQILITVTLQDYYRYENYIDVIPPDGAYIISSSILINDENGNDNGMIDFGETINLGVELKNIGVETATGLVASLFTESPYVTLVVDDQPYGNLDPDQSILIDDAFSFVVADDVPNKTPLQFELIIEGEEGSWSAAINLMAYAPAFTIGSFLVNDMTHGNANGRLDPGETADLVIVTLNAGDAESLEAIGSLIINDPWITLNNTTHNFGPIGAGHSRNAFFNVTVSEDTPPGYTFPFIYSIEAGAYNAEKVFSAKVGLILEDFETGDFSAFDWNFSGHQPWQISTHNPYQGTYSARSGNITHSQQSRMGLVYEAGSDDSISFYRRVSSEANYDYLRFYINGMQVAQWAGNVQWGKVSFPVQAGTNTFVWEYMKDPLVSSGEDAAWVDNISFPAPLMTIGWAGSDAEICESEVYQLDGYAYHYNSIEWSSNGTGTFCDPTILNPEYTPSEEDIESSEVVLSISITGDNSTISDELLLLIHKSPIAFAGTDHAICAGEVIEFTNAYAENQFELMWETDGTGAFDDVANLNATYTPSNEDYINGSVTFTLHATGFEACTQAVSLMQVTFHSLPSAQLSGNQEICFGDDASIVFELSGTAPWSVELDYEMGNIAIEETPWTWLVSPELTTTFALLSVTDANGCQSDAAGQATVVVNTVPGLAVLPAAHDTIDLLLVTETSYQIDAVVDADYYEWLLAPATAGELILNGTEVTIKWDEDFRGEALLSVTAVNDCGSGELSEPLKIELFSTLGLDETGISGLYVYPNPSEGIFKLSFNSNAEDEATIMVHNLVGETVYAAQLSLQKGRVDKNIALGILPNGTYILSLSTAKGKTMHRIVVSK